MKLRIFSRRVGRLFGEPDDPETRSVAHLRMRLLFQDALEQACRVRSDVLRPVHHARGSPLEMRLVTLRPVLSLSEHLSSSTPAEMGRYALSLVEDLDRRRCEIGRASCRERV